MNSFLNIGFLRVALSANRQIKNSGILRKSTVTCSGLISVHDHAAISAVSIRPPWIMWVFSCPCFCEDASLAFAFPGHLRPTQGIAFCLKATTVCSFLTIEPPFSHGRALAFFDRALAETLVLFSYSVDAIQARWRRLFGAQLAEFVMSGDVPADNFV